VEMLAEPGTGKVLTAMLKRITKDAKGIAVNSPEAIENFAKDWG